MQAFGIGRAMPIGGVKAEEAQDAQIIFLNALHGLADEADAPGLDVGKAADIIVHQTIGGQRKRVDGEIAALRVMLPGAAEAHARMAAKRLDILAQGRDLERMTALHQRQGAVVDAGRHAFDASRLGAALNLRRQRRRRHIDVARRQTHQGIAHRAADNSRFLARAVEHAENVAQGGALQPIRGIEFDTLAHGRFHRLA